MQSVSLWKPLGTGEAGFLQAECRS